MLESALGRNSGGLGLDTTTQDIEFLTKPIDFPGKGWPRKNLGCRIVPVVHFGTEVTHFTGEVALSNRESTCRTSSGDGGSVVNVSTLTWPAIDHPSCVRNLFHTLFPAW